MNGFHDRLRHLRQQKHMTLDELAVALETTKTTLSRYENSKRVPDADFVVKVSHYFKVSTDYLLHLSNNPVTVEDLLSKKHYYVDGLEDADYKSITDYIERLKSQRHKKATP